MTSNDFARSSKSYHSFQTSFEIAIFSGCFMHYWFYSHDSTKVTAWWWILDCVTSESLLLRKLHHSCFVSLLSFALSNKMQSKICYREEFNSCKIHRMNKICIGLAPFEEFANAVLQTLAICAKNCLSLCNHVFFTHVHDTNSIWNSLKSDFKGCLGSIVPTLCTTDHW